MMERRRHTPGPWECGVGDYDGGVYCNNELGSRVAIVYGKGQDYPVFSREEEKANARLIAAAPELLEAQTMGAQLNTPDFLDWIAGRLVYVHGEHPNVDFVASLRDRAKAGRAAIAKAEGRS